MPFAPRPPLLLLALACACGGSYGDDRVAFSYIHPAIIVPNCATAGCHSTLTQMRGIDLEDRASALVVLRNDHNAYVDIGLLLEGKVPNVRRMPPDQPLPSADIELIKRWLAEGAPDN
jgi:hypothetical protein